MFEKAGVFSARELASREEIASEEYVQKILIEGNCALDIVRTIVAPAAKAEYLDSLKACEKADKCAIAAGTSALRDSVIRLGVGLDALKTQGADLEEAISKKDTHAILTAMVALRTTVDNLEKIVSDDKWPLPKYREMLFLY